MDPAVLLRNEREKKGGWIVNAIWFAKQQINSDSFFFRHDAPKLAKRTKRPETSRNIKGVSLSARVISTAVSTYSIRIYYYLFKKTNGIVGQPSDSLNAWLTLHWSHLKVVSLPLPFRDQWHQNSTEKPFVARRPSPLVYISSRPMSPSVVTFRIELLEKKTGQKELAGQVIYLFPSAWNIAV